MSQKLFYNLGRYIVIAQTVECWLCLLLLMEREKHAPKEEDIRTFIASLADVRADEMLGSLKKKLGAESPADIRPSQLTEISRRRNHLVHRLIHDSRFLEELRSLSGFDLEVDVTSVASYSEYLESVVRKRAEELKIVISQSPLSSFKDMARFADELRGEIAVKRGES
jgi:hypothetical protein